jgi:hypothetical protein
MGNGDAMIDIRKQFAGSGYLITDGAIDVRGQYLPDGDTANIVCHRGTIYADGNSLVAALTTLDRSECRALRKLGEVIADGGDEQGYEVSVRFPVSRFRDVARIMRPRQRELARAA